MEGAAELWDCIIVGGGIIGSWTGYHLAKKHQKVLILDQFLLPHTRGSSGGQSRITRYAYQKLHYAAMMPEAFRMWHQLEKDTKTEIFHPTKMLIVQSKHVRGALEENVSSMKANNLPYTLLPPGELTRKYPQFNYDNNYHGVLDIQGGTLLATKCLQTIQNEFKKMGGIIQDGVQVEDIVPGSTVTVRTSKGNYLTKNVVLAAGPWSKDIFVKLGLDVPVRSMPGLSVFFKVRPSHEDQYNAYKGCPIFYTYLYNRPGAYRFVAVFPSLEYPGMVKMITRGEPPPYYCHPDDRDTKGSEDLVKILVQFAKDRLPGVDPTPRIMEPCVYTMTPDREYIIDRHPRHKNIIIGAGFSGTGFMRSPVISKLLTELVNGEKTSYDIGKMTVSRFQTASKL